MPKNANVNQIAKTLILQQWEKERERMAKRKGKRNRVKRSVQMKKEPNWFPIYMVIAPVRLNTLLEQILDGSIKQLLICLATTIHS